MADESRARAVKNLFSLQTKRPIFVLQVLENVSLKVFNTFGIDVRASRLANISSEDDLKAIGSGQHVRVLGGGSNVLLTEEVTCLLLRNVMKGIRLVQEDEDSVIVKVASGEMWHEWVLYSVANNWGGLENLSLIPGTVGAAPIQNIGAYGAEAKDCISRVTYWDFEQRVMVNLSNESCRFGYRDSIFKHELKDRAFIVSVEFRLSKHPTINTRYGAVSETLGEMGITQPTIVDVSQAVTRIRQSKLPDPAVNGNAGSFFKNPEIPAAQYGELKQQYPDIQGYPGLQGMIKVPAGWLIEQCGWKGKALGNAGVHSRQALVLVNLGGVTGAEVLALSTAIMNDVYDRFGIRLEREVQIW